MKKIAVLGFVFVLGAGLAAYGPALAASLEVGNETVEEREETSAYNDFAVVDTNNPVEEDGTLDKFYYFASNTEPFYLFLADGEEIVWVSNKITPDEEGEGIYEAEVDVEKGWDLGVFMTDGDTIAYSGGGEKARITGDGSDLIKKGDELDFATRSSRKYSIWATGAAVNEEDDEEDEDDKEEGSDGDDEDADEEESDGKKAISDIDFPENLEPINTVVKNRNLCLSGQWASIEGNHGFTNQGQCVAYYNQMVQGHIENLLRLIQKAYIELIAETQKQVNAKKAAGTLNQGQQMQLALACNSNKDCKDGKICNGGGKCVVDDGDENDGDDEEDDNDEGAQISCKSNIDCTDGKICNAKGKCVVDEDNSDEDENEDD